MDVAALCGCFANLVNGDDVWMVERRSGMRFLLEAAQPISIIGKRSWQHFDRHVTPQPFIMRAIDDAHPATSQQRQDFVHPDLLSEEQLRRRLAELFRFNPPCLKRQRVPLDKAPGRAVIAQQFFYLAAQIGVARAGLSEKTLARVRLAFQRRVIKLLNLFPALMLHSTFLPAASAAARTWPIASRGEPSRPKRRGPRRFPPR